MRRSQRIMSSFSFITLYRLRWVLVISFSWTIIGLLLYYRVFYAGIRENYPYTENIFTAYLLRGIILFFLSALMAYLILIEWRVRYRHLSLLAGWSMKTLLLLFMAVFTIGLIFVAHYMVIRDYSFSAAMSSLGYHFFQTGFLIDNLVTWLVIILVSQVVIEVDQKYSPGVFWQIFTGKYTRPRTEQRIIMFLDLKDSTPIAEQLGHEKYFSFISDFIYYVSIAVLENAGYIHQYTGDEVVVTWPKKKANFLKSINTVIEARRILQYASDYFRRKYDIAPEFRVGLHMGEVTIGEVGLMKKDLAISGEAMNITARIRAACGQLNQKFIVSQDYFESNVLKSWQSENLGEITLKGVEKPLQLHALKI